MHFSLGQLDVADKVGIGFFNLWVWRVLIQRRWYRSLQQVWRGDGIYLHPVPGTKIVGGGYFPSRFLGAGTESVGRGFGACNGVNHCGSGGKNGVSSWVPMWR